MRIKQAQFSPMTGPRLLLAALTFITTGCGVWVFGSVLAADGVGALDIALIVIFAFLFSWIALSFWLATAGFLRKLRGRSATCVVPEQVGPPPDPDTRTAILMPVYNEDPHGVFAGLRAIYDSLQQTGHGEAFDFFILSDTTDPDVWLAEELSWARLNQAVAGASRIFYRHRPKNSGRKAGNIADFCKRWGSAYRYMIVLDADSVMSGDTLVELVRRMESDAEIGILQAPPMPVNRVSLFARCQQFAARVYGPVFMEGFAWWSDIDGNYWGHNAIIRVAPFTQHCGLSALPGAGPLGGEILSHDFVEAALMRRAGLKVCLAQDLEGSYEECPPTLLDFAQRDQRWCQGNMQHIRLVFSYGIPSMSRMHLGMGAMSYLSSPLWLLSLILSFAAAALTRFNEPLTIDLPAIEPVPYASGLLFAVTMTLLLLPKLWGYILLVRDPPRLAASGGAVKAALSVLIETLVSILVAPIMMVFHTVFVISTFLGRRVQWHTQQRCERGMSFGAALAANWKQTVAGLAAAVLVWSLAPGLLPWLSPVLVGLIFAVPFSMLLSSVASGQALAQKGLLLTPEETAAPAVLREHHHFQCLAAPKELETRGLFRRLLTDPAFVALHRSILFATGAVVEVEPRRLREARKQLLSGGPSDVSPENRKAVLSDPAAVGAMHLASWTTRRKSAGT